MSRVARDHAEASRSTLVSQVGVVPFGMTTVTQVIAAATEAWSTGAVPRDVALQVPAVLRGRNLICSISTLPLMTVDRAQRQIASPLLNQIDPQTPNIVTLAMTIEDLLMDAVAWWRITDREPAPDGVLGFPRSAEHVSSERVSLSPPPGADVRALPSGIDPDSVVWVDGKPVAGAEMLRFDSPNPAMLVAARRAIRRAALLEMAAERYARTPRALGYFSPTDGADPASDEEISELLADWRDSRNEEADGYVPAALKYNPLSVMSPADLQLAELQKRAALDIANALGLDPEDLGISTTSRTYQNATDRRQDRINEVLTTYMLAITSRLSMNDVTRRGQAVRFDLADFLKPDPITRTTYYTAMAALGAMTVEEIRAAERLAPMPEAAAPAVAPAPDASKEPTMTVQPKLRAVFSAATAEAPATDAPGRVTFAVDAARANFKVDLEQRTIVGLAVPYGEVTSDWRAIQFQAGSIARLGNPEPVLLSHDGLPVGVVASTTDAKGGMSASLRISKTSTGDDALVLADDGAITGLSVGVDIHKYELDTDTDVMTVTEATLREISLTPFPAFESARVQNVRLTHQEPSKGNPTMSPTTPPVVADQAPATTAAAVVPVPAQAAAPAIELTLGADFAEQFAAAMVAAQPEVPAVISPRAGGRTATLSVAEALPYRFDGRRGPNGHDFSTDLFATDPKRSHPNAAEATQRLETFLREVFADVSTGDVNELNPTRNRPDLYVAALEYPTPIWSAINKGGIADATPFTVPQFSSSSGLVADHTESTEPTGGTFVTTSQTITPAPLSGKVEITRETIDQGGNPAVSGLIWNEILRAWNEALEAKAVAVLEALTPTAIPLTAGAADDVLAGLVEGALADLQFVAGGARMRELFLNKSLFRALVNAVDSTGRKLYPFLAAQNASGQVSSDFGSINVGGLVARPSWALPTSASAEESSYLFSRSDVHGWSSAPQRLQFEYEVKSIWLGVWGYAATACTRTAGVREITYDPTA